MTERSDRDRAADHRASRERAVEIQASIEGHTAALVMLARQRRDTIVELVDSGAMTQSEVAEMLGLTRSRVSHILNS